MSRKVGNQIIGKIEIGSKVYYVRPIKRRNGENEKRVALFSSPSSRKQLRQMDFSAMLQHRTIFKDPFDEENHKPPYINRR